MAGAAERRQSSGASAQRVHASLAAVDAAPSEAIAVFCWSDARPLSAGAGFLDWRLCGALSRALEGLVFGAAAAETMLMPAKTRGSLRRVFAFGLGAAAEATSQTLRQAVRLAFDTMTRAGVQRFVFAAPGHRRQPELEAAFLRALADELPGSVELVLVEHAA